MIKERQVEEMMNVMRNRKGFTPLEKATDEVGGRAL